MDYINYLIVGSGPAGVAAARILESDGVCVLDAGDLPEVSFPYSSLNSALRSGNISSLLGNKFEMLANVINSKSVHAKLRAEGMGFVLKGNPLIITDEKNTVLTTAGSYAAGGMSNAWGAQLLRYTQDDLNELGDWPIDAAALNPFYTELEKHIGISGQKDDMSDFFGGSESLISPVSLVPAADYLLGNYNKQTKTSDSFRMGRARLGVLTEKKGEYTPYNFSETEFFTTENPGIYTARRTLSELLGRKKISYLGCHQLISFNEKPDYVDVVVKDRKTNELFCLKTRHLLLGCGTVQSAQLVLQHKQQLNYKLPFIDHPPTLIPFFLPMMFGSPLPLQAYPIQLTASSPLTRREMISFYYPGGMLWSDLFPEIPLPMNQVNSLLKNLLGGMLVAQIWEASRPMPNNTLSIDAQNKIIVSFSDRKQYGGVSELFNFMRRLGAYSLNRFVSTSPPGWGFHYAGCLPMRKFPKEFETFVDGRLWDSRRVRVIDGAVLPSLPSKNHSLTIMANSARIASETLKCGY